MSRPRIAEDTLALGRIRPSVSAYTGYSYPAYGYGYGTGIVRRGLYAAAWRRWR
jgi:hypothetical protein